MSWGCDATLCSNNKCCQSGVCCGDTCCAGGSSCCGNICCDASTFCCESNFCCLGGRDACAIFVGLGSENSTISAVCTNTAESLAGSTITIPVLIGSSTRIGNTTGGFVTSSSSSSTLSSSRPPLVTDPSHGKPGSKNNGSNNSGSGTISSSVIAGMVVAGIAALCLLAAAIWLCRRHKKSNHSRGLERHQPTDGGHESALEKADIQKHSLETQASEVYELEVPPHEIGDGPLSPIRELPVVEKPAELDGSETMTRGIQVAREEDPGSGDGSAGGWF